MYVKTGSEVLFSTGQYWSYNQACYKIITVILKKKNCESNLISE